MTWRTPEGERVLTGAEATLVRQSLAYLRDCVVMDLESSDPDDGWSTGIKAFDRLSHPVRLAMLATVGTALFRKTPTCPPLNVLTEGTAGAIFETLNDLVAFELDDEDPEKSDVRALILNAMHQVDREQCEIDEAEEACESGEATEVELSTDDESSGMPHLHCDDPERWRKLIGRLSERVLWDDEFLAPKKHINAPPENDGDYFRVETPKPTDDEIQALLESLDGVLGADHFVQKRHAAELRYIRVRLTSLLKAVSEQAPPGVLADEIETILEVVQWPEESESEPR